MKSGVRRKAGYRASAFHQGRGSLARAPLGESHFRPLRPFRPLCPLFDESPKIQLPNLGSSVEMPRTHSQTFQDASLPPQPHGPPNLHGGRLEPKDYPAKTYAGRRLKGQKFLCILSRIYEGDGNSIHPAGRAQGFRALGRAQGFRAPGERRSLRNLLSF